MKLFDRLVEKTARQIAQCGSRRGFLKTLGVGLVGGASLPVLPVARAAEATPKLPQDEGDATSCDYWRYCAVGWISL